MERYIDAEKIKYHKLSVCEGHGLNFEYTVAYKHEVDAIPTADVVPKSEGERLVDKWIGAEGLTNKVAREIFEEIEKLAKEGGVIWTNYARAVLANLRKKYTEGEE